MGYFLEQKLGAARIENGVRERISPHLLLCKLLNVKPLKPTENKM